MSPRWFLCFCSRFCFLGDVGACLLRDNSFSALLAFLFAFISLMNTRNVPVLRYISFLQSNTGVLLSETADKLGTKLSRRLKRNKKKRIDGFVTQVNK